MRILRIVTLGVALITIAPVLPAHAEGDFTTAEGFLEEYGNGDSLLPRLYIRGIAEGIGVYNALKQSEDGSQFYCPPEKVGLVQYVAILRDYVERMPNTKTSPLAVVLLFALQDAFPCKQ
jgi:Rap1a immunity proteins